MDSMHDDHDHCVRAVQAKDARFDGQFITGVTTTGIYCRPSCPARTPAPSNMRFYPSAAAAHRDGFRACKRCLPDATPGSPEWSVRTDVVARAVRLVEDGLLDRADVPTLAASLGYTPRHLERLMQDEIGTGPVGLARAQRAQTARSLIERTDLPFSQITWAAGFGSIRTFNETIREVYARSPRELRARASRPAPESTASAPGYTLVTVRLPFRPPLETGQLFGHLVATAVPGVEEWTGTEFRRTLRLPRGHGIVAVAPPQDTQSHLEARMWLTDLRDLTTAVHRARRLLDLDADPLAVVEALGSDPALAGPVATGPGRRIPGCVDPEELAVRIVLGQQVSTAAARTTTGRLVGTLGDPVDDPEGSLTHLFPTSSAWAGADDDAFRMPASRRDTVRALAAALEDGLDLGPGADWSAAREELAGIRGVGPWTVESIAMRALGDPDAFVATDLGVSSAARTLGLSSATDLIRHAERWRPWRAYAVQYLWASGPHAINTLPGGQGAAS